MMGHDATRLAMAAPDFEFSNLDFYRKHHNQQLYYHWEGHVWWTPEPGGTEELIFRILGMNVTHISLRPNEDHGEVGHRINRELGLYCHPETGAILDRWQPFPDRPAVPVVPIANRIVQGDVEPKILSVPGDRDYVKKTLEIPLRYPHPLAKDPQFRDYCPGEFFEGTEYFITHTARPDAKDVPPARWARDCPWLPWMALGYEHPARLRFETTIGRVESFEVLPEPLVALVRDRLPIYEFAPAETDEPNVTSTTYFKKYFDAYLAGASFPIPEAE